MPIVDQYGNPMTRTASDAHAMIMGLQRQLAKAKYDAAQTFDENQLHWANADCLDPHAANSPVVRKKLRSRSRYEIIENNPFLKGTVLMICNDFVGGGPKYRIVDSSIPEEHRRDVEKKHRAYSKAIKLRQKLWRWRIAKIVDGEGIGVAYINPNIRHPINLDYWIVEADQMTSQSIMIGIKEMKDNEIDGIRFDDYGNPLEAHILDRHPGSSYLGTTWNNAMKGTWYPFKRIIHWFRKDRGWLRGIPELSPSLPLCAILRRYTMAVLRHAETAADLTAILETDGPGASSAWPSNQDEPFDVFPIDRGMIMNLPWGYKLKQLESVPPGDFYDEFTGAILREIVRPILAPYNLAAGTSKDQNMASAVVDNHVYKGGQNAERLDCNEEVLDKITQNWWELAIRTDGYFKPSTQRYFRQQGFYDEMPVSEFGWDSIGIDHTDPSKVATALKTMKEIFHMTDRDIQWKYFNRDLEDWQEEVRGDAAFMAEIVKKLPHIAGTSPQDSQNGQNGSKPASKPRQPAGAR